MYLYDKTTLHIPNFLILNIKAYIFNIFINTIFTHDLYRQISFIYYSSIDRYLRMRGCQYSIKTCAEFRVSQDVIRTKRKIAKQDGLGNMPNRAEALCPDDEERLWATGQMGAHSPIALLRALWYLTSKLMGRFYFAELVTQF